MQSLTRCGLLLGCLVLAACGREPQLELRFEEPVTEGRAIHWGYTESLQRVFQALGYKPGHLRYTLVEDDAHVLLVSLQQDPLSQEQREALVAQFAPILAARERWPARLELHGEHAPLPGPVSAALRLPGDISLVAWRDDPYGLSGSTREVFCHLNVKLEPSLPALHFEAAAPDSGVVGGSGVARFRDEDEQRPVLLQFSDPDLQRGLQDRQFQVRLESDGYLMQPIDELVFDFGSMGRHVLLGQGTLLGDGYEESCAERAEAFGRPFTLFMGKSVDRLTALAFLDAEK